MIVGIVTRRPRPLHAPGDRDRGDRDLRSQSCGHGDSSVAVTIPRCETRSSRVLYATPVFCATLRDSFIAGLPFVVCSIRLPTPLLCLHVASPALSACCWQRRSCMFSKQRGSSAAYTTVVTDRCLPHLWSAVSSLFQSCLSLSSMQLSSVSL